MRKSTEQVVFSGGKGACLVRVFLILVCLVIGALGRVSGTELTVEEREWLGSNPQLTFISQENYPPFEFVSEGGESRGMTIELARWVCEFYGIHCEFMHAPFADAQEAVLKGDADVLTSFFYSPQRAERFRFTSMMYNVPALIFIRHDRDDIKQLEDLQDLRIAMQEGDYAREFLAENNIMYERVSTESFSLAADVVVSGGADALIGDQQIVLYSLAVSGNTDTLKTVGEPLYIGRNCMAVARENSVVGSILSKGIEQARREGVLDDIGNRWIGPEVPHRHIWLLDNARYVIYGVSALLLVLVMVAVWSAQLRRLVAHRTEELRASRQFLGEAVRIARIARWEYSPQTGVIRLDEFAMRLLGLNDDLRKQTTLLLAEYEKRFVLESSPVSTIRGLEELANDTGPEPERLLQQTLRCGDGSIRAFRVILRKTEVAGFAGKILSGTIQDTTEVERADRERRESERRLQLALRGSRMAFWDYDVASQTFTTDDRWPGILGYDREEITPEIDSISSRIHEEDREHVRSAFAKHLAGEAETYFVECRHQTRQGSWLWVQSTGSVVERDEIGKPRRISGTYQDISERKRQERERQELDSRLEEIARLESLSVLAGGIAHDFNNLLVGMLGSAGIALSELPTESPAHAHVELIEKTARQASDLTRQMLAYSGKGRFVVAPVSLTRLVREMTHLLDSAISTKSMLRLDLEESVPAVEADVTQLRQVVMNLIINAAEALPDGEGLITIRTGLQEVDEHYLQNTRFGDGCTEGPYVFVEISDTGVGMTPDVMERIFDPFYTTKNSGHGLGLAAVLGIIRGHRGFLKVYSEREKGTTFKAGLPASEKADIVAPPEYEHKNIFMSGIVLVIDDHPTVRNVAARMLEHIGFDTLEADGGRKGLEIYDQHAGEIRVVLLDMSMPDMTGDEVFAQIRQRSEDVPILLMSGFNEQDATSRFVGKGLAGFLQKPFTIEDMRRVIGEVLPGNQPTAS